MSRASWHPDTGSVRSDREIVGSFFTYPEAEQAVKDLAERIPAEKLRVVGQGMQAVSGRSGKARSLLEPGIVGTAVGALVLLFAASTIGEAVPEGITVRALLVGAVCGFLAGVAAVFTTGASSQRAEARLRAQRYDIVADPAVADEALREIAVWRIGRRSRLRRRV